MKGVSYKTVGQVTNILLFVEGIENASYNELVEISVPDGRTINGQILSTSKNVSVIQVFGETYGIDSQNTKVTLSGTTAKMSVGMDMVGRVFDGLGRPRDGGAPIVSEKKMDINGSPINPYAREEPSEFIQTGISAIDGMNTLVRGQKLPIFSGSGMQHNKLVAQIVGQATTRSKDKDFYVVFCGMGINSEEANFFMEEFKRNGSMKNTVAFINLSSEPSMERLMLPRLALTAAEYLAYEKDFHVMVILTDMTNYCEALREISAARLEVPGRRGYPGYMYTDLASIYERAGKLKEKKGSITQVPVLTMPVDDITHPIPDLTGYITEGQIVLSRSMDKSGIYPNIDVLLSLSRLMNQGIGKNKTREDHKQLSDQLYAAYAKGKELRSLMKIVGEEALSDTDKRYLSFADAFEKRFINQDYSDNRKVEETLDIGWELLSMLDISEIERIKEDMIKKYGKWKQKQQQAS